MRPRGKQTDETGSLDSRPSANTLRRLDPIWKYAMNKSQTRTEIEPLISRIKERSLTDHATTGAVALLNVIPFAGGAVASIISDFANERRMQKVCDVLADLNTELEKHGSNPEKHLSKDQIVELVHETLSTASITSDERKTAALKRGLTYAFTSEDSFDRKQLFLHVLREATGLELGVMQVVYAASDPFIKHEGGPLPAPGISPFLNPVVLTNTISAGSWELSDNRENPGGKTLLSFLNDQTKLDEGLLEGALRQLDGKGLANAGPNLHRSDSKVYRWRSYSVATTTIQTAQFGGSRPPVPSPLEASRTKFGEEFLKFYR
jgi:hypothetical protein